MYKIGFHTNSRVGDTLEEILSRIKAAGFEYVMLDTKHGELENAIKLAQEIGLKVHAVHLPYRFPNERNSNDFWIPGEASKTLVQSVIKYIKTCRKYDVPVAVFHQSYKQPQLAREIHSESQGIKSFQKILKATKNCNVKLALENLNPGDNKYMEVLLDNIADPRLGFCYDCGHNYLYTPEIDFIAKYGDRVIAVHLQDNLMDAPDINQSNRDIHLLPFDGKIDFKKVMRDIAKSKYNGPIMLEAKYKRDRYETSYKDMPPTEFLQEARKRGIKLAKMLDEAKSSVYNDRCKRKRVDTR